MSDTMKELADKTSEIFERKFQSKPEYIYYAPGRVNLIGEHTDYNGGFVFPCAIDRGTFLAIKPRSDNTINLMSGNIHNETSSWQSNQAIPRDNKQSWSNYLRGVNDQFLKQGKIIRGMDVVAMGNVPRGAGLSSSASFSVAFATAINEINQFKLSQLKIALLCQASENQFVGTNCGIMDQLISAAGKAQHALLIDCKKLSFHPIALPRDVAIIVVDSKVKRGLVDSEYNDRRKQCESAAQKLGVPSLREATLDVLAEKRGQLSPVEFIRAQHVVTENARTEKAALAFQTGNYALLSKLMAESHNSMRDDFEITTPEIDSLVDIIYDILQTRGGVRMTGGGFGGCVVAMAPNQYIDPVIAAVKSKYPAKTKLRAEFHICTASDGAGRYR